MDVVSHLVSPDRPRDSALPMVAVSASEQARDQVLLRVDSITKQYADQAALTTSFVESVVQVKDSFSRHRSAI